MNPLYPPGPRNVPADFTSPTSRYRLEVALVLLSLLISLALYLGLVCGSAYLCYRLWAAPWPPRQQSEYHVLRIIGIIFSALLFLYLLKGLFKGSRQDRSLLVEIKEADQPELFDFIRHICAETGAPFPRRVYASPEVNAAVFYQSSFLSLILPTPKNLLIGLGLVNMLNLSEFKAVLAHEFGHFSQKSMKVSSYVYIANKVLADIIYGRDFLDDLMNQVKRLDIRIAIFVWTFLGILWGLRKLLEGVFKAINILQLSLMRQMEFNADRVAVSVAGSDAMVHALLRTGFADQAFRQLSGDLWSAADHGLYSRDIFLHLAPAANVMRRRARNPKLGEPPAERGPKVQVFAGEEGNLHIPLMWSTHPSNRDREANAKEAYLAADIDERSAWLLFRQADELRRQVSERYYQFVHKPERMPTLVEAPRVQTFLDDEYAETTYPEQYFGFYDNRYLEIADINLLTAQEYQAAPPADLAGAAAAIFGPGMETWVKEHVQRLTQIDMLTALQSAQPKNAAAPAGRAQANGPSLLERLQEELNADQAHKARIDAEVYLLHKRVANHLDGRLAQDLVERYQFHVAIQVFHRQIFQAMQEAQAALNYAGRGGELSMDQFAYVRDLLRQAAQKLFHVISESSRYFIPGLRNLAQGTPLREFLLQRPVVSDLGAAQNSIDPAWVQSFLGQLAEVQDRLKRLLFKSLGGILAAQENIVLASKQRGGSN